MTYRRGGRHPLPHWSLLTRIILPAKNFILRYYTHFIMLFALMTMFIFIGSSVLCKGSCVPMSSCDHDTRMCIHIKDCLEKGARVIFVRTVDTDVIVIIAGLIQEWISGWHLVRENIFDTFILTRFVKLWVSPSAQPYLFTTHSQVVITTSQFFG